jgi:poly [ADP-ribose] polymerase
LGKGIYFADVISKSFNYCCARDTNDIGFILLCEVAIGDNFDDCETMVPHNNMKLLPNYTCRRGLGKTTVNNEEYSTPDGFLKNVKIPVGPMIHREGLSDRSSFLYNEYVIFDARLYRFKYLVKIKSV